MPCSKRAGWTKRSPSYQQALQIKPDSPGVLNNLAWLLATVRTHTFGTGFKPSNMPNTPVN